MVPICLYCLNCRKFGQLILRKIIKIVATRCQIRPIRLKCNKFDFRRGCAPDPAGGAYSAPPDVPIAGFKGALLLREGRGDEGRGGRERRGGRAGKRTADGAERSPAPNLPLHH